MSQDRDQPKDPQAPGRSAVPRADPDATVTGPLVAPDPDATVSGPMAAFMRMGDQDPEATVKPAPRKTDESDTTVTDFDPDATIAGRGGRRRANPFAPRALPEALQANLAALGGLNTLIAFANPILSAVPQVRAAKNHPDPALLKETLQDLVEAFEAGASKAGTPDESLEAAIYALCCLADDAASSTEWGRDWQKQGLLENLRGEDTGSEEFFALLAAMSGKPEANADLLELMYVCLALGFEGRFRGVEGGQQQLDKIRADLHQLVTRRRAPPAGGLSARWQGVKPGSMPRTRKPAARAGSGPGFPWRATGGAVAVLLAAVAGYLAMRSPPPAAVSSAAVAPKVEAPAAVPAAVVAPKAETPAVASAVAPSTTPHKTLEAVLSAELQSGAVALSQDAGRSIVALRDEQQFGSGRVEPGAQVLPVLEKIGAALERVPGAILVKGYTDSLPVPPGAYASNLELSAARAQAAATVLAAKLSQPQRVASEGAADADPVAPNDTAQNRARNRRVVIILGPQS